MSYAALKDTVEKRVHVGQGEHFITSDPSVVLSTILGSCVAMCVRDPLAGVGGMNHFLLPEGSGAGTDAGRRYGAYAMELLINDMLKAGARRDRLEAKLFGGGRMFDSLRDVGRSNADFAEKFLRDEGIPVVGGSLRGDGGQQIGVFGRGAHAQNSSRAPVSTGAMTGTGLGATTSVTARCRARPVTGQ